MTEHSAPTPPRPPKQPSAASPRPSSTSSGVTAATSSGAPSTGDTSLGVRYHPIAPPDTPMQFRAVGVVEGRYVPSDEQFTRGTLITPDGEDINAVLLGRVMSLVRKYIQDDRDYLWVVYPRTGAKTKQERLHVQISGVWAPEEMGPIGTDPHAEEAQEADRETSDDSNSDDTTAEAAPGPQALPPKPPSTDVEPDMFSIRGEVVRQKSEESALTVKIVQSARKNSSKSKPSSFKLNLHGVLPSHALGEFWDFEVKRQGSMLEVVKGVSIGPAPKPKPRKNRNKGGSGAGGDKPRPRPRGRSGGDDKHERPAPPKPRSSSRPDG
ncbi:MAG: hypothetical protein AAGM36_16870 [Cyanobacteria bacterium J06597_1]